ncbi:MAG: SCP2 sterol-binding domain-containing protein [Actinomycetota bacterium]|nr:SCP2 sterol-binding domain-containing protein [Actinomycetota bacterium]
MASGVAASELRELIDHALAELDLDERRGALMRATDLKVRLEVTDLDLVLRLRASEEGTHHLSWAFAGEAEDDGAAGLTLAMDAATANAYLQGRVSLPVAIARRQVRCSGDLGTALIYLPALRMIAEPYRSWVSKLHPHLAVA